MSEYTSTTYAVRYEDSEGEFITVACSTNKAQAKLFVMLLNSAGFRAEVITRSATFPEWPNAKFEYQKKDEDTPPNAWSTSYVREEPKPEPGGSIFDF